MPICRRRLLSCKSRADVVPVDADGAGVDIQNLGKRLISVVLPPIGPDEGDRLTMVDGQADPLEQGAPGHGS